MCVLRNELEDWFVYMCLQRTDAFKRAGNNSQGVTQFQKQQQQQQQHPLLLYTIMSSTRQKFTKQKAWANKKRSELKDHEKVYLMKKEIDSLRMQLKSVNDGSIDTTTGSSSNTSSKAPILTLFLFLGVLVVGLVVRRRRRSFSSLTRRPRNTTTGLQAFLPIPEEEEEEEGEMSVELQESASSEYQPPERPNLQFV
eukprot:scaffold12118_cov138-Cylindrotheca_fusiformis.AAC.8